MDDSPITCSSNGSSALSLEEPEVVLVCLSDPTMIDLISKRKAPMTSEKLEETGDEDRHDRATIDKYTQSACLNYYSVMT